MRGQAGHSLEHLPTLTLSASACNRANHSGIGTPSVLLLAGFPLLGNPPLVPTAVWGSASAIPAAPHGHTWTATRWGFWPNRIARLLRFLSTCLTITTWRVVPTGQRTTGWFLYSHLSIICTDSLLTGHLVTGWFLFPCLHTPWGVI